MSFIALIKMFRGVRFRLTFVYSTLFGLFICSFAFVISRQSIESDRNDFDSALLNYAIDISAQLEREKFPFERELRLPHRELKKEFPFTLQETYYLVKSSSGEALIEGGSPQFRVRNVPYSEALESKPDYTHRFVTLKEDGQEFRAVNLKITALGGEILILQVAAPTAILREEENRYLLMGIIIIPLLIIFSSIASYIIAGNALAPIRDLIRTANTIAAKNLSLRVPEVDTGDEIYELSKTFNTLLGRLEKSFEAQENFVANASHQLNTPLAIIKGELDVLESKERSLEDHEKFRKSLREELERLISLVEQMLLISRVEAGQESFHFQPIRIDEVLLNTSSRLSGRAREKKIILRFNMSESLEEGAMLVNGERQLLYCLFENILDNAIKYSPPETVVSIAIGDAEQGLTVEITDEGPGINEEDFRSILSRRFQRGSKILPGTGIGLSISYQIAEYHDARIEYSRPTKVGSLFRVIFLRKQKIPA